MRGDFTVPGLHHLPTTSTFDLEPPDQQTPKDRPVCHFWRGPDNMHLRYDANVLCRKAILLYGSIFLNRHLAKLILWSSHLRHHLGSVFWLDLDDTRSPARRNVRVSALAQSLPRSILQHVHLARRLLSDWNPRSSVRPVVKYTIARLHWESITALDTAITVHCWIDSRRCSVGRHPYNQQIGCRG